MATHAVLPALEIEPELPGEYERLRRFILYHLGGFTLGLVRVNDPHQRDGVIASLRDSLAATDARLIRLDLTNLHPVSLRAAVQSDPTIRTAMSQAADRVAIAVVGAEHLIEAEGGKSGRPPFAAALNIERDALRGTLPVPIILFLTDYAMDRLDLVAPDFFDWYSGVFRFRASTPSALDTIAPQTRQIAETKPTYSSDSTSDNLAARLDLLEDRRVELAQAGPEARLRLGQVLKEMGDHYADLAEYQNRQAAVSYLKQAAEIFHEAGQPGDEAAVLERLGEVCYWINDYPQACRRYEAALPIYRDIGDRLGEANCIQSLGDAHVQLAEYALARQRYEAALPIYRDIGARLGEANCIKRLGDVHVQLAEYALARQRYEAALPIYRDIGARLGEANCIQRLGDVHVQLAEYALARQRYEAALPIYRDIGDRLGEANCIQRLGDVHVQLAEYALARQRYEAALPIYRDIGARLGEANCIRSLGDVHVQLAEYALARQRYEAALPIYRDIGARLGEANCIQRLGDVHVQLAEYALARQRYEAALPIYRDIGARLGEANCIKRLGDVHVQLAEYALARQRYEAALPIYRDIGDRLGEANCIRSLGDVHVQLAEYALARQRYEAALPIYRDIGDRLGEANCIQSLGDVHVQLAEYALARQRYEAALPIYRDIGARLGEANSLTAFGDLALAEEDYAAARARFEQAWAVYQDIGDSHGRTYIAPGLARALLASNAIDQARQVLEEGAALARAIDGRPNLRSILWLLARILEEQNDLAAALKHYNELLGFSPDAPDYLRRRAQVLLQLKDYRRALIDYHHLVELNAQDAWAYNGIGNVLEKEGDLEGAVAAYSQAITHDANEAAFVRNRASTLLALDRLDEAHVDCETASRLAPDHTYTHGRWGDLHLARGEWAEAETSYRVALAQDDAAGWRLVLAVALWGQDRLDEGWTEFNAALENADDDTRAETLRDYRRLHALHPALPALAEAIDCLTKET